MKNSEIHKGLSQKEIRDFLAMGIIKTYEAESQNKKDYHSRLDNEDVWEAAITNAKMEIKFYETLVDIYSTRRAILKLIEQNNWQEHDVSDDTYQDISSTFWMNFVGTIDEHEALLHEIYPNK